MRQRETDLASLPDARLWQERLQRATAAAQMFVWENDLRTGRQTWAGAAAEVIGCQPQDLPACTAEAQFFVHPDDRGPLNARFAAVLAAGGTSFAAEFRGIDGRSFHAEAAIDCDADGTPLRVTGVTRDVTGVSLVRDRAVSSEALAHARTDELLTLYNAAPVGLCVLDQELRLVRMNQAMKRMTQVAPGAMPGEPLAVVMPCLARQAGADFARALRGEAMRGLEFTSKDPDRPGAETTLRVNALPLQGAAGVLQGVVLSVEDVTAERRAGRALAEREALLAAIGASTPQMIHAKDSEGRLLYANAATLDLLGLPQEGDRPRPDWSDADSEVIARGTSTVGDEPVVLADGRRRILQTARAPLRAADGAVIGLVALSSDVTEQRATEARRAFLLDLADLLRSDSRAAAVTTRALARFFAVGRVGLAVAAPATTPQGTLRVVIIEDCSTGTVGPAGPVEIDARIAQDLRQGRTVCLPDIARDIAQDGPAPFGAAGSVLIVPLLRNGQFAACLFLADAAPRDWSAPEITLAREAAERSWDAIERAQSEAALRLAEARHRRVLDASAAVVWSTGPDGGFAEPQPSWAAYTGQEWPEHAGHGWMAKVHSADLPGLRADWHRALENTEYLHSAGRVWHQASATWRHFVMRGAPLRGADGRILEWIGALTDIDDQRRAEHNLRRSEARLRLAQEAAGLGIFELDPASGRLDWDSASLEILRAAPEDVRDLPALVERLHPDDRPRLLQGIHSALTGDGDGRLALDLRLGGRGDADDETVPGDWISLAAQAAQADDGAVRLVGALRDISARKANELALQSLNARLAQRMAEAVAERNRLWSVTEDLLLTADRKGHVLAASDSWARALGVMPRSIAEALEADVVHPDDRAEVRQSLAALKQHGGSAQLETRLRGRDGGWRRINWRLAQETGPERLYAIGRDVTAEREQAAALSAAQAQLHEAQKIETIGQLTGGVAHDFNNLLAAILSTLGSVQLRLTDPEQARLVGGAIAAAERGVTLTARLLAFARRQELKAVVIDPVTMIAGMRDLLTRSIGPQITLHEDIPNDLPALCIDANQLELALLNLAVNARDAMPEGGDLTLGARHDRAAAPETDLAPGDYVVLSMADTGTGMDETVRRRAAEPFFTTKGVGQGTGLGLSMVQGLAAQSGGAMRLRSAPGHGTTVEIWLPVSATPAPAPPPQPPPEAAVPGERAQRALVVLVVDDDPLVAMGTTAMLEDLGHRVIEVYSAEAALTALDDQGPVDLVITDHAMPGMTGTQLAAALRQHQPDLPIALATGYADLPNGTRSDLPRLAKPFGQTDLAALLRELCG